MADKNKNNERRAKPSVMTERDRESEIKRLERERLMINEEIEALLKDYAKESGNNSYKPRKHKFGKSPNDYSYKKI